MKEIPKIKIIYCKDCKYYRGEVKFVVRYPMGEGRSWKYLCGLYNKSVFDINLKNDCKDFNPKPLKRRWVTQLIHWLAGPGKKH